MDISINAKVSCSDGPCGRTTHVIIKPTTEEITHLVVSNEAFPETEYLIPIDQVAESTSDHIQLMCSSNELLKMPIFDEMEFVPSNLTGFIGNPYMMWPFYVPAAASITLEREHIPADELAIRRGARVEAADGPIGSVNEFLIDPGNDHITHLVVHEGHLWGQKDVTIPMSQIDHYRDNTVHLKLNKEDVKKLPSIPVEHSWPKLQEKNQKDRMNELVQLHCSPVAVNAPQLTEQEIRQLKTNLPSWEIRKKKGELHLEKIFQFEDFRQALTFTNRVGKLANEEDHHPAILTEWGKVTVTCWTHKIKGLHKNDFILAAKIEQLFAQ